MGQNGSRSPDRAVQSLMANPSIRRVVVPRKGLGDPLSKSSILQDFDPPGNWLCTGTGNNQTSLPASSQVDAVNDALVSARRGSFCLSHRSVRVCLREDQRHRRPAPLLRAIQKFLEFPRFGGVRGEWQTTSIGSRQKLKHNLVDLLHRCALIQSFT